MLRPMDDVDAVVKKKRLKRKASKHSLQHDGPNGRISNVDLNLISNSISWRGFCQNDIE